MYAAMKGDDISASTSAACPRDAKTPMAASLGGWNCERRSAARIMRVRACAALVWRVKYVRRCVDHTSGGTSSSIAVAASYGT